MKFGNQNFIFSGSAIKDGLVLYYNATSSLVSGSFGVNPPNWNSIAGINGTLYNNPIWTGSNGGIMGFNGSNQYTNLGYYELYNNFSIAVWFKSTSQIANNTSGFIVSKDFSSGARGFGIGVSRILGFSGRIYLEVNGNPVISPTGTVIDGDNIWHFMALQVQSNVWSIYLDGNFLTSVTPTPPTPNALAPWYSPGRAYVGVFDSFIGQISDLQLYNRPISSSEIVSLYSGSKARFGL